MRYIKLSRCDSDCASKFIEYRVNYLPALQLRSNYDIITSSTGSKMYRLTYPTCQYSFEF